MKATTFDVMFQDVPYQVKVEPFSFNMEARFKVSYNNSPEYIFAWDEEVEQFVPIGSESSTMPDGLEQIIAGRLAQLAKELGITN